MDFVIEYSTYNAIFKTPGIVGEIMRKRLYQFIQGSILYAEREIKERTPQGVMGMEGGLRGRIFSEMRGNPANPIGIVAAPSAYALPIEEGRRPGQKMPPPAALRTWVEKFLNVPEEYSAGVAFVVARSIGKKGFPGKHMFRDGIKATMPHMEFASKELGITIKADLEKRG
jgi:hypothetical protein